MEWNFYDIILYSPVSSNENEKFTMMNFLLLHLFPAFICMYLKNPPKEFLRSTISFPEKMILGDQFVF
jgi:hypothetical protein